MTLVVRESYTCWKVIHSGVIHQCDVSVAARRGTHTDRTNFTGRLKWTPNDLVAVLYILGDRHTGMEAKWVTRTNTQHASKAGGGDERGNAQ